MRYFKSSSICSLYSIQWFNVLLKHIDFCTISFRIIIKVIKTHLILMNIYNMEYYNIIFIHTKNKCNIL